MRRSHEQRLEHIQSISGWLSTKQIIICGTNQKFQINFYYSFITKTLENEDIKVCNVLHATAATVNFRLIHDCPLCDYYIQI